MTSFLRQFGGKITPSDRARYAQSPNWKNGSFQNLESFSMGGTLLDMPKMIYKQLSNREGREPKKPLPILPFNKEAFLKDDGAASFIWYGHAVILMRIAGMTVLIDPMLGPNTTPIAPFATRRFSEGTLELIDDFPEIDLLLMSHDHYDHLDMASIDKLKAKTKQYAVALGVKRHLVEWGVEAERVQEFDWWDSQSYGKLEINFTPSKHFSGRGLRDRFKSLWGGWTFKTESTNLWFSGDGGYGSHFKEIGRQLGPFDYAFAECGQYNVDWKDVHQFPDEAVQGALDARAACAMPYHWAGFALSYQHKWWEPAQDFVDAAQEKGLDYSLPKLGELVKIGDGIKRKNLWWEDNL
ncbi:MAG: MBL fold metallo-hydrolase [Bacteroidota bacterium]